MEMQAQTIPSTPRRVPWNKGKLIGPKSPLRPKHVWSIEQGSSDRRSKELRVTEAGEARFRAGVKGWVQAQRQFDKAFGAKRTADMRALLHAVASTDLSSAAV